MFETKTSSGCEVRSFPVGPLQCNCTIVWDPQTQEAIVVDPGADFPRINQILKEHQLRVSAILHTHAHFDHIGAASPLHEFTQAPLYLHPADEMLWTNLPMQGNLFGIQLDPIDAWNEDLDHGRLIRCGRFEWKTLFTPGHTPGSCSFHLDDLLLAGDTLFRGSIGRTDLWGGDFDQISQSIKERLYTLNDQTLVICGHGPNTQIGVEKRTNPFVSA